MYRLGWVLVVLIALLLAAFGSMVRIVGPSDAPTMKTAAQPAVPSLAVPTRHPVTGAAITVTNDSPPMVEVPPYPGTLTVPVEGVARDKIYDSWGDPRGDGTRGHTATDIMAPGGTMVVAAAPGTIEKLFLSNGGGGISAYVRSPDRQWVYYYAHLGGYAAGVAEGMQVQAGDPIGYVGDTGNAGPGNYHLHFGISWMQPGEGWWQGTPINPYPLLARARAA